MSDPKCRRVRPSPFGKLVAENGGTVPQDEGGVRFHLQDWQGSVRAGVNAAGYVKSRTDHQAFGEPIESGIGLRTTAQGFGSPASNRQGYGLTEKDSTGLNHTWFRKNENRAGRWTSPDPYNGSASVGNPQSWNRYSYVESQPTNFVDPSGLLLIGFTFCEWHENHSHCYLVHLMYIPDPSEGGGGIGGGGVGGGVANSSQPNAGCNNDFCNFSCMNREERDCENRAREYFNSHVVRNVVLGALGLPAGITGLATAYEVLAGMTYKEIAKVVGKFLVSKVFSVTAVLGAVWNLYTTTQSAVAIENECRRHIPDKCGKDCGEYLPNVGRA